MGYVPYATEARDSGTCLPASTRGWLQITRGQNSPGEAHVPRY